MTAVIYARYSSDSQREASIEGQLRDCKDYAEKNGRRLRRSWLHLSLHIIECQVIQSDVYKRQT